MSRCAVRMEMFGLHNTFVRILNWYKLIKDVWLKRIIYKYVLKYFNKVLQ